MPNVSKKTIVSFKIVFTIFALVTIGLLKLNQTKLEYSFAISEKTHLQHSDSQNTPRFEEIIIPSKEIKNHAASIEILDPIKKIAMVVWYGGSKELGHDVKIYSAQIAFDKQLNVSKIHPIIDKPFLQKTEHRHIHGLGNPIIFKHADKLWLFFTSTIGGWATASIHYMTSSSNGDHWSNPKALLLSPLLNISNTPRGRPVLFEDKTAAIPIYNEMYSRFGEIFRIGSNGKILAIEKLPANGGTIQPTLIAANSKTAFVFMRQKDALLQQIYASKTINGGKTWERLNSYPLPNWDTGLSATMIDEKHFLIAFNKDKYGDLTFAIIDKDKNTICLIPFKNSQHDSFRYPYIMKSGEDYLLAYSYKKQIALAYFNQQWLEQKWKNCIAI